MPIKQALATADDAYLPLLEEITFRPVFIMGDHRSGTTILYRLLQATGHLNIVQAYHIIKRDEILYNHIHHCEEQMRAELDLFLHQVGMTDRILDQVTVSSALPEEYGFVLEQGLRPQLRDRNLPRFSRFCRKIQYVSNPTRALLLKNPWDFTNFRYIKAVFPGARFIFLHRHPVHVVNSQLKAARSLYRVKSPYHALLDTTYERLWSRPLRLRMTQLLFSSRFDIGFRVALRHVSRATKYFLKHVASLSTADYITVKFENLCTAPRQVITQILDFLGLEMVPAVDYHNFIKPRRTMLLDEVRRHQKTITETQRSYLAYCNYPEEPLSIKI